MLLMDKFFAPELNVEKILHKSHEGRTVRFFLGERSDKMLDADGERKMRPFVVLLLLIVVMLVCGPFLGTAHAMAGFSRKYGMKCGSCHRQRIPELNDFGVAFYKNGFVLPGQDDAAKKGAANSGVAPKVAGDESNRSGQGAVKPSASQGSVRRTSTSDAGDDEEEEEKEEEKEEGKPSPPPTVVYRLPSQDGSVYFTDNPVRKGTLPPAEKKQWRRRSAPTGSVSRPAKQPEKQSSGSVPASRERFRSYEECMERSLINDPSPISAEEIMDRLAAAEKRCSPYPPTKR